MAVAKSTINVAPGQSTAAQVIEWSTLSSGANNTYFDVNGKDGSNMLILFASLCSTGTGTTGGLFYLGASDSSDAGTTGDHTFSARALGRMAISAQPPTTAAKEALSGSTTLAKIAISVAGPFETARFKDSDGYIQLSKRKSATDAIDNRVAAIYIPSP